MIKGPLLAHAAIGSPSAGSESSRRMHDSSSMAAFASDSVRARLSKCLMQRCRIQRGYAIAGSSQDTAIARLALVVYCRYSPESAKCPRTCWNSVAITLRFWLTMCSSQSRRKPCTCFRRHPIPVPVAFGPWARIPSVLLAASSSASQPRRALAADELNQQTSL